VDRRYLIGRVAQAAFTVWAVVSLAFVLIRFLPGSPRTFLAAMAVGSGPGSPAVDTALEGSAYDPGTSILAQYVTYVSALLQGDFGQSLLNQEPVLDVILRTLPWTLFLIAVALPLTFALGISLGALMAYWEGTRFDVLTSIGATVLNAVPYYVAAILMLWPLGYLLGWFPTRGTHPPGTEPGLSVEFLLGALHHATLPILSLVITGFGFIALSMRANSVQVLGEGYVRVANLRGLADRTIAMQYVGRNAVLPLYTAFLIAIGFALGGTVVLEQIFQYRGLGLTFFRAVVSNDYPLMMAAFILITTLVVLGLLVADLTYGLIDPRAAADAGEGSGADVPVVYRLRAMALGVVAVPGRVVRRLRGGDRGGPSDDAGPAGAPEGGAGDAAFHTTADVMLTRRERFRRWADEYLLAPARIMWGDPKARLGLVLLGIYLFMGTIGPRLVPRPQHNQGPDLVGPFQSLAHPLGTDGFGQDMLSLMVHGTPEILAMVTAGAVFATTIATAVGLLAGYAGGLLDRGLTLLSDIALTIPGLPLVIVLVAVFEPTSPWAIGVLVVINAWGGIARQIRSQVLVVREEPYVEVSGIMSLSTPTILGRDVLPNVAPYVLINAVNVARQVIIAAVALYFLGILSVSDSNWGLVLDQAHSSVAIASVDVVHWLMVPMLTIVLFILGLILVAQSLDRVFNPRVRTRHATHAAEETTDGVAAAGGD
jgi:ABC-type dipeptide/oligopeptide/nickel transport system permease component